MTKKAETLSIVLPVYNEHSRILDGVRQAMELKRQWAGDCEIIVVDDGSTDECVTLLDENLVTIVSLPHKGKGSAVREGMLLANNERIVFSDIDWSVPVEQVIFMLQVPGEIVIASREISGARRIAEPPWRHLLGKGFNRWVQWMLISGYEDTQCGCKIFSKRAAESIFLKVKEVGWAFDVEVLVIAHLLGFQVIEYPVSWQYQADSKIKIIPDVLRMARAILRIKSRLLTKSY